MAARAQNDKLVMSAAIMASVTNQQARGDDMWRISNQRIQARSEKRWRRRRWRGGAASNNDISGGARGAA